MRFITPYKSAVGLGSGRTGTEDHWRMMVSGAVLAVLTPFFVFTVLCGIVGADSRAEAIAFFGRPFPATVTGLYLVIGLLHWIRGTRMMIDDYVHSSLRHWLAILATLIGWVLIAVALWSLLRLSGVAAIL